MLAYLAATDAASRQWQEEFVRTLLERDMPQLGITIAATGLRRFWTMLTHYHAQIWKGSELARSLGASEPTMRKYLDLKLERLFVVHPGGDSYVMSDRTEALAIIHLRGRLAQLSGGKTPPLEP